MLGARAQAPEAALAAIRERLGRMSLAELQRRAELAERELFNLGITFTVYSERNAIDRILPFDVIPRVLTAADWRTIESGVKQRVQAINLFLARRLSRPEGHQGRRRAGGPRARQRQLPPPDGRARPAAPAATSRSAASTSCATRTAASWCSRTTRARRRACPT